MVELTAGVSDLGVGTGNRQPGLGPVLRSLLLAGQLLLRLLQLLLGSPQETRGVDLRAVREDRDGFLDHGDRVGVAGRERDHFTFTAPSP